ncbi:type I-G CRISPR-associated helicase/endonuclease Cas3g [Lacunimicrobium album]
MDFDSQFEQLTGNKPLPWQRRLFEKMVQGVDQVPQQCMLPTGLGKTSVIAIWLLALAKQAELDPRMLTLPRRMVYVVNRRTVVDQATSEAEMLRKNLSEKPGLKSVRESLASLCSQEATRDEPLAISTLRGQFADNGEWTIDPARPAIVVGTVDMIGSRLLFSGYRSSFRRRPLHAAYLGQDVLLVHDEAHLEEPFQRLLESISIEQTTGRINDLKLNLPFRVMALSATQRTSNENDAGSFFELDEDDFQHPTVKERLSAEKTMMFHPAEKEGDIIKEIKQLAQREVFQNRAVLVYLQSVGNILKVREELEKLKFDVAVLTGTIRGKEREDLMQSNPVVQRFLPQRPETAKPGTVFLLSTSAGEVGVNISADHLICDLTPFDSMAQRFGRVNRFGHSPAEIHVVHPSTFATEDKLRGNYEIARERTLALLKSLRPLGAEAVSASPEDLSTLKNVDPDRVREAFTPTPQMVETTDILLDAWSLTSITDTLPGRPPVERWLHGIAEWEPPQTQVAWRVDVELPQDVLKENRVEPKDLLDDYPLKPIELLTDSTKRVNDALKLLAEKNPEAPVWLIENERQIDVMTMSEITSKGFKIERLNDATVILSPLVGGLNSQHMLDGNARTSSSTSNDRFETAIKLGLDVSDEWYVESNQQRKRALKPLAGQWKLKRTIWLNDDDSSSNEDPAAAQKSSGWYWYVVMKEDEDARSPVEQQLDEHLALAEKYAQSLVKTIGLEQSLQTAVTLAAKYHDLGKNRALWQRSIGNTFFREGVVLAKSGHTKPLRLTTAYRHEFGSLHDIRAQEDFQALDEDSRELVLHLIAAHHGRARPHFPADAKKDRDEAYDPLYTSAENAELASQVPSRFARLQRRYGRWGLAYLESLVRSADILASQASLKNSLQGVQITQPRPTIVPTLRKPEADIRIDVDVTNPGQFFACCGLLELADRRWLGAEGWFEEGEFCVACGGTLKTLIEALTASSFRGIDSGNATSSPIQIEAPFDLLLNWWHDQLSGGREMKVWAGTMEGLRIARAMQSTMAQSKFHNSGLLNVGTIAYDAENPLKKVEPFYFDARRGPNAHNRDVGFSANTLSLTSTAHPAVELLCLIGLQRVTPARGEATRLYRYATWSAPIAAMLATSATSDLLRIPVERSYQFENWYRTGQKKHKAFLPSIPLASRGAT